MVAVNFPDFLHDEFLKENAGALVKETKNSIMFLELV